MRFSFPTHRARATNSALPVEPDANWLVEIGPVLSLDSLPAPETKRWSIRRKAMIIAAVRTGVISLEDACRRYKISIEEFLAWQRLVDSYGLLGLRVTHLQDYRANNSARTPTGRGNGSV